MTLTRRRRRDQAPGSYEGLKMFVHVLFIAFAFAFLSQQFRRSAGLHDILERVACSVSGTAQGSYKRSNFAIAWLAMVELESRAEVSIHIRIRQEAG